MDEIFILIKKALQELRNNGATSFLNKVKFYLLRKHEIQKWRRQLKHLKNGPIKLTHIRRDTDYVKNMVSVIIPVYDRTDKLQGAIESILHQSYTKYELIIVTDGSPRETLALVEKYRNNPAIKIFHYYNNTGYAVRGRNKGIKEAVGEFIAFQDSDDIADPDRLKISVEYMNKYGADLVYGGWRVRLDGTRMDTGLQDNQEIFSPECSLETLLEHSVPCQSTVMVKRNALIDVGGFKPKMKYREDHELWLRLAYYGYKLKAIPKILTNLRIHKGNNELKFVKNTTRWYKLAILEYKRKSCLPKKNAYIVPGLKISGGVAVVLEHANRLLKLGHDVMIITQDSNDNVSWFPNQNVPIISRYTKQKYLINKIDTLIATGWSTVPTLSSIPAERKIYFVQSDERRFYTDNRTKKLVYETYSMNCEYMTEARWIRQWLKDEFKHDAYLIRNGLNTDIFHTSPPIIKKTDKTRVLLEGPTNIWFKGMDDSYNTVKELDCEIWIVSSDGGPKKDWRYDRFFGNVPLIDMKRIYSSCDILLKMSKVEGFFGPPMEAMACGCAVVVAKVTGYNEYIVDNYNALVVEMGDIAGARSAIQRLINDKKLRNKLIKNGYKTVKNLGWDKSIQLLEEVIQQKHIAK